MKNKSMKSVVTFRNMKMRITGFRWRYDASYVESIGDTEGDEAPSGRIINEALSSQN